MEKKCLDMYGHRTTVAVGKCHACKWVYWRVTNGEELTQICNKHAEVVELADAMGKLGT